MKAIELMNELCVSATDKDLSKGCDGFKAGNPEIEVTKAAVAMVATPEVIKAADEWGAKLLVVHEPTYYHHMDEHSDEKIETEKRKLIESSGMALFRYHDHSHWAKRDEIAVGMLKELDFDCEYEYTDTFDLVRLHLKESMTPAQVAAYVEKKLNIKHVRICGAKDVYCNEISAMFGTPGGTFDELKNDKCEILLLGEAIEWMHGEYARDAAQLGYKKSMLILGHVGSERDGMKFVAERIKKINSKIDVKYFDSGEVYGYAD